MAYRQNGYRSGVAYKRRKQTRRYHYYERALRNGSFENQSFTGAALINSLVVGVTDLARNLFSNYLATVGRDYTVEPVCKSAISGPKNDIVGHCWFFTRMYFYLFDPF